MRRDTDAIGGHKIVVPQMNLDRVKEWAKRAFSKERIGEMAVTAAAVVVLGYVGGFLCQVAQSY